jgi:hypothetical protein
LCVFTILLKYTIFNLLFVGHRSETEKLAKSTNVIVPHLFHLHRRIVKRTGSVVKEKSASERGRKRTGEGGDIGVHKLLRMMRPVSVIVIAGGSAAGQLAGKFAKLGHDREAHSPSNRVVKTNGWKNLHPLDPLSLLFPLLFRP